ncbi:hypothetical protein AGMMS49992_22750 [Clostridia bacterium]|nr:hypothetical protein AGMMS49992_22750 [Clostridia bacterium]
MNRQQETEFKNRIAGYTVPSPDEQRKRQTIAIAQTALLDNVITKTPLLSLVSAQARYISKPLWFLQLAALLATWVLGNGLDDIRQVETFMFVVAPILTFYTVPEFVKSRIYGMSELEMTCKNSPVKMVIAKLFLIGTANIMAIIIIALILSNRYEIGFATLLAYGLLPFNVINCITLLATDIFKIKASYALLSVSLVAALIFVFGSQSAHLLQDSIAVCSLGSAVLLITLLIFSIKTIKGRQDILVWN